MELRALSRRAAAAAVTIAAVIAAAAASGTTSPPESRAAVTIPAEPRDPERTGRAIVIVKAPGIAKRGAASGAAMDRARRRIDGVLDRAELVPEVRIPQVGAVAVEPPPGQGVAAVRRALSDDPGVARVDAEYRRALRLTPDDPAFAAPDPLAPLGDTYQWHLREQRFQRAWGRSKGGSAKVAVIDTGIDATNPDLGDRIVAAVDQDEAPGAGPATVDEIGHGTHVAGLACAAAQNGYGGASSGFRCRLIVEKSDLVDASIARSITDATDRGADVVNMSFGGPGGSKVIKDAIRYARKRDVIMVAAASNENTKNQGFPALYLQPKGTGPKLKRGKGLVVTAAQYDGKRAWFKPGRGNGVSLAAYGAASSTKLGIFSNFPANVTEIDTGDPDADIPPCECRTSFDGDDRFAYLEGTSMAAPQVAGTAALIRSRRPNIDAKKVIRIVKRRARGERFRGSLGWGILNAGSALRAAVG